MIDRVTEENVLNALNMLYDITDVYFHKGKLYVINEYDLPSVEELLASTGHFADVEVLTPSFT